jgi:hypothetical protein
MPRQGPQQGPRQRAPQPGLAAFDGAASRGVGFSIAPSL